MKVDNVREHKRIVLFNKQKGLCAKCGKVILHGTHMDGKKLLCMLPCGYEAWKKKLEEHEQREARFA